MNDYIALSLVVACAGADGEQEMVARKLPAEGHLVVQIIELKWHRSPQTSRCPSAL